MNYPAPMGVCDVNKLRTQEARKILKYSDQFLEEYNKAIIFTKEKASGTKIFNNYQKLDEWIQQYLLLHNTQVKNEEHWSNKKKRIRKIL